jgi:hypothetical protein
MENLFEKGDEFRFQIGNKKYIASGKSVNLTEGTWDWD